MNLRKTIDYSAMYTELDALMGQSLPQMELYREIGRLICSRPEKGAAIMASEYLQKSCPDVAGFSPRNVRRMREFFRTYENNEALMTEAMKIGWTQNVLIMERCTDDAERQWYIKAILCYDWSKLELAAKIDDEAHLKISLAPQKEVCYTGPEHREDEGDGKEETERPLLQSVRDAEIQRELQWEGTCSSHLQSLCKTEARAAGGTDDVEPSGEFAAAPLDGFRTPLAEKPYPRPKARGPGNGPERLCGTLPSCGAERKKAGAHDQNFGSVYQRRGPRRRLGADTGTINIPYQSAATRDRPSRYRWNFYPNRAAPSKTNQALQVGSPYLGDLLVGQRLSSG